MEDLIGSVLITSGTCGLSFLFGGVLLLSKFYISHWAAFTFSHFFLSLFTCYALSRAQVSYEFDTFDLSGPYKLLTVVSVWAVWFWLKKRRDLEIEVEFHERYVSTRSLKKGN